jgi:hypothetical protein
MFQKIKEWIKQCGTHIECVQAIEKSLEPGRGEGPARLLYVGSSNASTVTLVEREMNMEYIALSYCWVDRLCIIQDDVADISHEIAAMPEVYKIAYLTLSASSAVTSQDVFLQSRDEAHAQLSRSRIALSYICPDGSIGSITLITHREPNLARMPNTLPVDARAWTMQEQRLSSRLLQFCSYHLL